MNINGLVTQEEREILSGEFQKVFNTFARSFTVFKAPIVQTLVSPSLVPQGTFGFGAAPVQTQEIFIPVSQNFSGVIRYYSHKHLGQMMPIQDTNTLTPVGQVQIQVMADAYNYIESGQTDLFSFDQKNWYFAGRGQAYPFLGGLYYKYQLAPKT